MSDLYSISLDDISLDEYEITLDNAHLLPGRVVLKTNLKVNFNLLKAQGITNLKDLSENIKTDVKRKKLSKLTNVDDNYLTILRREINGYIPKPIDLSDFPEIDKTILLKLSKVGIKTSKTLYEKTITKDDRQKLVNCIDVDYDSILMLTKLSDLGRVNGVGPVFAQMLYDVKCDTIVKFSQSNEKTLYKNLIILNDKKNYTKAKFTEKDLLFCIKCAKKLPHSIQYGKND